MSAGAFFNEMSSIHEPKRKPRKGVIQSQLKAGDSVGELHHRTDIAERSYNAEKVTEDALEKMQEQ